MAINISIPDVGSNLHPQITVLGVGGSGGNAVNNMIDSNLEGVDFLIANTDAQALQISKCKNKIQLGVKSTKGLGAGMRPDVGKQAAEEALEEISEKLEGSHMVFIAAGMGGGTGTGAAPVIARLAREKGILTVGVVTKPFHFEGTQRMKLANKGIDELQQFVDTLLTIPNQNLFRIANEKTTFADAFKMADDVLYAGVRGVTDLMVQPGLINLDFSDVKNVMSEMGKAMMGTGQHSGEGRAVAAAEAAIANPLIDDVSLKGAKGLIINITGGSDLTLYEVDEAANRIKQEVDENANIIYGTTCDERLEDVVRVSIVATGIDADNIASPKIVESNPVINETGASLSIDNSVYQEKNEIENTVSSHDSNHNSQEELVNENEDISVDHNTLNSDLENEVVHDEINENLDNSESFLSSPEDDSNNVIKDSDDKIISENEETNKEVLIENEEIETKVIPENEEMQTSSSVRRLSLFDKLDDESISSTNQNEGQFNDKSEPILENNLENDSNHLHSKEPEIQNDSSLEDDTNLNEDEYNQDNQENEEDLLDIPTFLRRQAN